MNINQKQIESVLKLDGQKRYEHFIKTIADTEEVFGLDKDGWALASDGENSIFPVWSAKEYAELCANGDWNNFKAVSFSLEDFMQELLPNLKSDGVLLGVFYTPENKGVTPDIDKVMIDIARELERYK